MANAPNPNPATTAAPVMPSQAVGPGTPEPVAPVGELAALRAQLRAALEQQAATSEVLKAISRSAFDLGPVLQATVDHGVRLCRAETGFLYLVDGDVLRVRTWSGVAAEVVAYELAHPNPRTRGTAAGRAALDGVTVHIVDVLADPDYEWIEGQRGGGFRTLLAVPIWRDREVVGVIAFARNTVMPFTEPEIRLVELFADQSAIAIENVRLFNETKEALERQTATAEILRAIAASPSDEQPVLDAIAENAARFCVAEDASLWLIDHERLGLRAHHGPIAGEGSEEGLLLPILPTSLTGQAVLERGTVHVADLQAEAERYPTGAAVSPTARAVLSTPLLLKGAPIGALTLRRTAAVAYTDHQRELAETFADQAVIAIENVRLFNEIQEKSQQLEGLNRDLAAASKHKSEFLANMSHELRTPLNAIIGFSEVLLEGMFGALNEQQAEYQRDILSSGRHQLSLINDILDLSKVEAGRMDLERSAFSLPAALRSVLMMLRERASSRGVVLEAVIAPEVGTVDADERKIKQVVLNLLSNAVKFTPSGGRVALGARLEGDSVLVTVRDTGVGIAPADQARVFEEFAQARSPATAEQEGTGLGLTLSKKFIELHGGEIWVESEIGTGSTFSFRLPLVEAAAAEDPLGPRA